MLELKKNLIKIQSNKSYQLSFELTGNFLRNITNNEMSNNTDDPNFNRDLYLKQKKQETLDKLDNAKFGCFHVRACVVSGIGFLTVNQTFYFST